MMRSANWPGGTLADLSRRDLVSDETSPCALRLPLFGYLPKLSGDCRPMARIPSLGRRARGRSAQDPISEYSARQSQDTPPEQARSARGRAIEALLAARDTGGQLAHALSDALGGRFEASVRGYDRVRRLGTPVVAADWRPRLGSEVQA